MPRLSYSRPGLTGLIDSDSDDAQFDEQSTIMSPALGNENAAPPKKARGRPKGAVSKVVKAPKSPAKKAKRPALKDRTNALPAGSDSEGVDEMAGPDDTMTIDEEMPSMSELDASAMTIQETVKPVRATKAPAKAPAKKAPAKMTKAAKAAAAKAEEVDDAPKPVPKKKPNPRKRQREEEEEIPETQVSPMDLEDEDVDAPTPMPVVYQNKVARTATNTRQPALGRPKVSTVPENDQPDPVQPKNEGDLRKQLEILELKYRNLQEVGINEAERTFENHKRQSEESRKSKSTFDWMMDMSNKNSCGRAHCDAESRGVCTNYAD